MSVAGAAQGPPFIPESRAASPLHVLMLSDVYFPRVNGVSTSIQTFRNTLAGLGYAPADIERLRTERAI